MGWVEDQSRHCNKEYYGGDQAEVAPMLTAIDIIKRYLEGKGWEVVHVLPGEWNSWWPKE